MAKKYYFVNGYSEEEVKSIAGELRDDAEIIKDTIIIRLNDIEAANARAELKEFNAVHNRNIELVG